MYEGLLEILRNSPITHSPQVTSLTIYGRDAFRVTIRATVTPITTFQIWLNHNPHHTRYAYQLLSHGHTLLRWDNAPHHPQCTENYPHHFHDGQGQIHSSPLHGEPLRDLPTVLARIEQHLSAPPGQS